MWMRIDLSILAPTRGATLSSEDSVDYPRSFNPRSYKRSDDTDSCYGINWNILSIHAPTRGATICTINFWIFLILSIHAPTRGATGYKCIISLKYKLSIHAPTRGATTQVQN